MHILKEKNFIKIVFDIIPNLYYTTHFKTIYPLKQIEMVITLNKLD